MKYYYENIILVYCKPTYRTKRVAEKKTLLCIRIYAAPPPAVGMIFEENASFVELLEPGRGFLACVYTVVATVAAAEHFPAVIIIVVFIPSVTRDSMSHEYFIE